MSFKFEDDAEGGGEGGGMMRWLITYADLITLLLAFFVVLFAEESRQTLKFQVAINELSSQLAASPVGQSLGPSIISGESGTQASVTSTQAQTKDIQHLNQLETTLSHAISASGLASATSITSNPQGVMLTVSDQLLFPSGSATLSPTAVSLLSTVGKVLESVPNEVEVAGYTDSTPMRSAQFPSNWQLSAMRASNVVQTLADVPGETPSRFMVTAFSKYHPMATNATSQGRAQNRRVEIIVLRQVVSQISVPLNGGG